MFPEEIMLEGTNIYMFTSAKQQKSRSQMFLISNGHGCFFTLKEMVISFFQ